MKHTWALDEDGEIDLNALDIVTDSGGCNGPKCTVCGTPICMWHERNWRELDCEGPDEELGP